MTVRLLLGFVACLVPALLWGGIVARDAAGDDGTAIAAGGLVALALWIILVVWATATVRPCRVVSVMVLLTFAAAGLLLVTTPR